GCRGSAMPTIREMNARPPKRMIVRVVVGVAFVVAVALYVLHVQSRDRAREAAVAQIYAALASGHAEQALARANDALETLGETPDLTRAAWSALMAGGGKHGRKALLRDSFPYKGLESLLTFQLAFSNDGRFVAAIDGSTITVWNVL